MTAYDVDPISRLRLRALQRCDNIRDHRRLWYALRFLLFVRLLLNGHAAFGSFRGFQELRIQPITRGADAPLRIVLLRQRVARAKRNQLSNRRLDIPRVDFTDDAGDRAIAGNRRSSCRSLSDNYVEACDGKEKKRQTFKHV